MRDRRVHMNPIYFLHDFIFLLPANAIVSSLVLGD
jgi:hypothetical protein